MVDKVIATPAAVELIESLKAKHGPGLMFHQSGGCCDNSAANCYLLGEITTGAGDVYLGDIGGCPFSQGIRRAIGCMLICFPRERARSRYECGCDHVSTFAILDPLRHGLLGAM